MEERDKLREIAEEVVNADPQEAMYCTFCSRLSDRISAETNKFISDNILRFLSDTYLELSKEYPEIQELVDESFVRMSKRMPGASIHVESGVLSH